MDNIIISNNQFAFLDIWYERISDSEREQINLNYTSQLDYLGIKLASEDFTEDGFEFSIIDEAKWNKAKQIHSFL
jgi:hypothetical protein